MLRLLHSTRRSDPRRDGLEMPSLRGRALYSTNQQGVLESQSRGGGGGLNNHDELASFALRSTFLSQTGGGLSKSKDNIISSCYSKMDAKLNADREAVLQAAFQPGTDPKELLRRLSSLNQNMETRELSTLFSDLYDEVPHIKGAGAQSLLSGGRGALRPAKRDSVAGPVQPGSPRGGDGGKKSPAMKWKNENPVTDRGNVKVVQTITKARASSTLGLSSSVDAVLGLPSVECAVQQQQKVLYASDDLQKMTPVFSRKKELALELREKIARERAKKAAMLQQSGMKFSGGRKSRNKLLQQDGFLDNSVATIVSQRTEEQNYDHLVHHNHHEETSRDLSSLRSTGSTGEDGHHHHHHHESHRRTGMAGASYQPHDYDKHAFSSKAKKRRKKILAHRER
ncbi:unnamed protein product, partial [Amoebophrya sp. A25]|eukprot:GSA25T00002455001.1